MNTGAGIGWQFDQNLESQNGASLPSWLAYIGYFGAQAPEFARLAVDAATPLIFAPQWLNPTLVVRNAISIKNDGDNKGSPFQRNRNSGLNIFNAIFGSVVTVGGAAGAFSIAPWNQPDINFSHSSGLNIGGDMDVKLAYRGLVGVKANVANESFFGFTGTNKNEGSDSLYINAGIALPLGIYIPLLSYYNSWSWDDGGSSSGSSRSSQALAAVTPGLSAAAAAPTSFTGTNVGGYISAGSGSQYPTAYLPESANTSYYSGVQNSSTGAQTSATVALPTSTALNGADTGGLQLLQLSTTTGSASSMSLYNPGSGLKDGTYNDIPILGVTISGSQQQMATASFTVVNGSIDSTSFYISSPGIYLSLPETQPNSGVYALILDVFSTQIASSRTSSGETVSNILANIPLITVDSTGSDSPITVTQVQRVSDINVPPQEAPQSVLYPTYNSATNQITPVATGDNSVYTYSNIPVQLLTAVEGDVITLLNPQQDPSTPQNTVPATVYLSGGVIQSLVLQQPLIFSADPDGEAIENYYVELLLPQAVIDATEGLSPPVYAVTAEQISLNNFVSDSAFASQTDSVDAGVYLADGLSDSLPLYAGMAAWPVQNRVTYIQQQSGSANGSNTNASVVYLNGYQRSSQGTIEQRTSVSPDDLSLVSLYNNPSISFSAASTPTAISIGGNGTYSGSQFVAWVEAADPVVPQSNSSGDEYNGSQSYQDFMQALYGNQRINFRINAGGSTGWLAPELADLYKPDNAVISQLKTFNVNTFDPTAGISTATFVVWTETSIDAIKGAVEAFGSANPDASGNPQGTIPTVIRIGRINPSPKTYQWNDLFSDSEGNSTIATIPWTQEAQVGLTVNDITMGSKPLLLANGTLAESPVLSWSQVVRTPYRESVLNSQPTIYLQFNQIESGVSNINIGSLNSSYTATTASQTGLNFAIAGALPASQATAVQNLDGTGVLSTGLGSAFSSVRQIAANINTDISNPSDDPISNFTGWIDGTTLTVSNVTTGEIQVGDTLSGPGVAAGTTITASGNATSLDPSTLSFTVSISQTVASQSAPINLEAINAPARLPLTSFGGSIDGTTLTVDTISSGNLAIGDDVLGEGIIPGTMIVALQSVDAATGLGTYTVNNSQTVVNSALAATPGVPTNPYTIEFWAKLQPDSNPSGAGLVAFGQPSSGAVGSPTIPEGWLLNASFIVDRITYQQAVSQEIISEIPDGISGSQLYGWGWGVIATGANTSAMNGNGGKNLYSNSLFIANLLSGLKIEGVNEFLANYNLDANVLVGLDGSQASVIANVPQTQLQFSNTIDASTGLPSSSLNAINIATSSSILNQGVVQAPDLNGALTNMFQTLWNYQEKTGESKVNFSLAPSGPTSNNTSSTSTISPDTSENYTGYPLDFFLSRGAAVSVNGSGQLVFDVGLGTSLISSATENLPADLRDGEWHYIVATYLPVYQTYSDSETAAQLGSNVGTASLYVDNNLVATNPSVFNAFPALNLNDQALLLANNVGGAIDQFALYDKALTSYTFTPDTSGDWPQLTAAEALGLLASVGTEIATKTPDVGQVPGAISQHWAAHTVNPNDALLATYTSSFDSTQGTSGSWSQATNLNPISKVSGTTPSYQGAGSIQNSLVISVPTYLWTSNNWILNSGTSQSQSKQFFNPSNQQLSGVSVQLTNLSDPTQTPEPITINLTPDQVLIGGQTLLSLQPFAAPEQFDYTVLSNIPAFSLVIPADQLPQSISSQRLQDQYSATYSFTFSNGDTTTSVTPIQGSLTGTINGTVLTVTTLSGSLQVGDLLNGDGILPNTYVTAIKNAFDPSTGVGLYSVSQSQNVPSLTAINIQLGVNDFGTSLANINNLGTGLSADLLALQSRNSVIATAAVIEQAPLQLKYIDSGILLKSSENPNAPANSAVFSPASSFGQSQVVGSFIGDANTSFGWLAIAQPFSTNAVSNPAGRIWIQYTGQSSGGNPSADVSQSPATWLNALADSNFSPDSPNLPLLGNANNPSTIGGLLIQADPTAGWGQNFGQTMLVADVNSDGVLDLVIGAPQANGGGRVIIVDGNWIKDNLTSDNSSNILNLANLDNPENLGSFVTLLTPSSVNSTDDISVANFGSALAFEESTATLWIGAPNYQRQLSSSPSTANSLVPIGALYSYSTNASNPNGWDQAKPTKLTGPVLGYGGTTQTLAPDGTTTTSYWGSQFGTAIAVDGSRIAVSAPGVQASMLYSGTEAVQQAISGVRNPSVPYGDGALVKIQLPSQDNNYAISSVAGTNNSGLVDVATSQSSSLASEASTYMQNLKELQGANIVTATNYDNQAIQTGAVGAVFLFNQSSELTTGAPDLPGIADATFYGAAPWNTLGNTGFGSSLSFSELTNNNSFPILCIGAPQTGGTGALYFVDTSLYLPASAVSASSSTSNAPWPAPINIGTNEYLAHLASGLTLYGAEDIDNFGNGLLDLGDVNQDGYSDLLIQAYNASLGAGNGYVLFGSDQLTQTNPPATGTYTPNPATGNVALGSIGQLQRADGSSLNISILSELGYGTLGYTGQGSFGAGDVNGDGINDIPLGSGPNGNAYLTWGHPYLEAISSLQLSKLSSNTGYLLDGLATTTQGTLRSIGDFNGDGYDDFISIQPGPSLTQVRLELGANTQEILADYSYDFYTFYTLNGTNILGGGDINGDGYDDITLFLDENFSSAEEGNQGAGSTTAILYGRSGKNLPIGSGFGLLAPVSNSDGTPLLPRSTPTQQLSNGFSDAAPAFITVGNTLYAAIKSPGSGSTSIFFGQSNDGGQTWQGWIDLENVNSEFSTTTSPTLAFYDNKLYLGFLNSTGALCIASGDPVSQGSPAWSAPTVISTTGGNVESPNSQYAPQLINNLDSLGILWVDSSTGTVMSANSTNPSAGSWNTPVQLKERQELSGIVSFLPITATQSPTATWLGNTPVLAVNNNGSVNVYAGTVGNASLELTSSFTAPSTGPAISSAPAILTTSTGLVLSYTNADGSVNLNRLDILNPNGTLAAGVVLDSVGRIDTSLASLTWDTIVLDQANSGLYTTLGSALLSVNELLFLANISGGSNSVLLSAIPSTAEASDTIWLNSTIQLSDGNGGWSIAQAANGEPFASASSLTPAGDLNQDGFDDLFVTANNVSAFNAGTGSSNTGLRIITGAANKDDIISGNDSTATRQLVHLAAPVAGSQANTAPVLTMSGGDINRGNVNLTISAAQNGLLTYLQATGLLTDDLMTPSDTVTAASSLFANISPSAPKPLPFANGWGEPSLYGNGDYGDLNGDGLLDYLDPTGNLSVYSVSNIAYSLWSIRAAGDVNGNGVDDVLLTLNPSPTGPGYGQSVSGQPVDLQTVLVDGSLFHVEGNRFSLSQAAGSATTGWSTAGLKTPLSPYGFSELYDLGSAAINDYVPQLQNWFEPILTYEPGQLVSASSTPATSLASAESYSPPAVVVSPEGQTYVIFSGADGIDSGGAVTGPSGLWMAYQTSNGEWSQFQLPQGADASSLSPSATFYNGTLYVAYVDTNFHIHVIYCSDLTNPTASSWSEYQVITNGVSPSSGQPESLNEYTLFSPTLLTESGRLALYFPVNQYDQKAGSYVDPAYIHSLYSTAPDDQSGNGNWGSTYSAARQGYTGFSTQISAVVNGTSTALTATAPIAAALYQGHPVLAIGAGWTGNQSVNPGAGDIYLATQVASSPTQENPTPEVSWNYTNTGIQGLSGGIGLTTDQALLYLTSATGSPSNLEATMWSLSLGADGVPSVSQQQTLSGLDFFIKPSSSYTWQPYIVNGSMKGVWTNNKNDLYTSDITPTFAAAKQASLAGYSMDGNVDINGDGFADILLSDPSNPAIGVDNQYALFGGDYLGLASQVGTPANDTLLGTPLADVIYTLGGSDFVLSNGGADVIYTGAGDDQVSITGNSFFRIDAGSGFDSLLLEGLEGQAYDFQLNPDTPGASPQYYAGTKLKSIELVNSTDYGANNLSFDVAAVNAINPDRILFIIPDSSDSIALSGGFARNNTFDTSFAGSLWSAFSAGEATSPADTKPTLVYVLNPAGASAEDWLNSQVTTEIETAGGLAFAAKAETLLMVNSDQATEPEAPLPSEIISSTPFGDGLFLEAFRSTPSSGLARFRIRRSNSTKGQLIAYCSSSANSNTEPNRDYEAIAGLLRLEPGEISKLITVPLNSQLIKNLRTPTLSLNVQEVSDRGQQTFDLLLSTNADAMGRQPALSGLAFQVDPQGQKGVIQFRADTTTDYASAPQNLELTVTRRPGPDVWNPQETYPVQSIMLKDGSTGAFDLDGITNEQILNQLNVAFSSRDSAITVKSIKGSASDLSLNILLNPVLKATTEGTLFVGDPINASQADLVLKGTVLTQSAAVSQIGCVELAPGVTPADLLADWQSFKASALTLFSTLKSDGNNVLPSSLSSFTRTFKAGNQQSLLFFAVNNANLEDLKDSSDPRFELISPKTPTTRNQSVSYQAKNGLSFQLDLINDVQTFDSIIGDQQGTTPILDFTALAPAQTINGGLGMGREAGFESIVNFYQCVDPLGAVLDAQGKLIRPGDEGYLDAALRQGNFISSLSDLRLPDDETYSGTVSVAGGGFAAPVAIVDDGDRVHTYFAFAAANSDGISHFKTLATNVFGLEDMYGGGDFDYNDRIITLAFNNVI